jgi:Flp pilus assembly CpaF family ATPase
VTIEDDAELQLKQPHVVRLEIRPPIWRETAPFDSASYK